MFFQSMCTFERMQYKYFIFIVGLGFAFLLGIGFQSFKSPRSSTFSKHKAETVSDSKPLKVGVFSMSLSVRDLEISKRFYETLGFKMFAGDMSQNYLIMKNENTIIGLFKNMFEGNMMTFNPGWDENATNIDTFNDVREIQNALIRAGYSIDHLIKTSTGPASFLVKDPDGNIILFDQHR